MSEDGGLKGSGRYRRVWSRTWHDTVTLSARPRLLLFYVLTGPQTTRCGIFAFSPGRAAEDLNCTPAEVLEDLAIITDRFGIQYDAAARVVFDPTWFERNRPDNPKILTAWLNDIAELPATELRSAFDAALETLLQTFPSQREERIEERSTEPMPIPPPKQGVGVGVGVGVGHRDKKSTKNGESHSTPTDDAVVAPTRPSSCLQLRELWNETTAPPIPRCRDLTAKRERHARARLQERSLDDWKQIFSRIQASSYCRGENDRGWVASFDWVVEQPDVAVKVLEGNYDDPSSHQNGPAAGGGPAVPSLTETREMLARYRRHPVENVSTNVSGNVSPNVGSMVAETL